MPLQEQRVRWVYIILWFRSFGFLRVLSNLRGKKWASQCLTALPMSAFPCLAFFSSPFTPRIFVPSPLHIYN